MHFMTPSLGASAVAPGDLERYSAAITLSDMEIFVFPELLFSLVLANLMSPRLWAWREDPWFDRLDRMSPTRRAMRLKQYIIDHYVFNLDLNTWGLTTKERELERFQPFVTEAQIARSNALFGYEGDRYYFDLDIRRHFGLDQVAGNLIPYWKTETLEAMDAFRYKPGYATGAGECVSLSTLYAAALFLLCRVPLADIFLLGTPLHSQNFVAAGDGLLTNNRRVVTKAMWFNGTELSAKARRALRHEQVTIVSHHTGHMHSLYPEATIHPDAYSRFRKRLYAFLNSGVTMEILANFLRQHRDLQPCFQIEHTLHGTPRYIPAETVYHYEQSSSFKVNDATRARLLSEIDADEFCAAPLEGRLILNRFEEFFRQQQIDLAKLEDRQRLEQALSCQCTRAHAVIEELTAFTKLQPRLPDMDETKTFTPSPAIELTPDLSRDELIRRLQALRAVLPTVDLAFYAYRDLAQIDWTPFFKAALERSPVAFHGAEGLDDDALVRHLSDLPNESIYDGTRIAQPDEVWNFGRGDGFERAVCLASVWKARHPNTPVTLRLRGDHVETHVGGRVVVWPGAKGFERDLVL